MIQGETNNLEEQMWLESLQLSNLFDIQKCLRNEIPMDPAKKADLVNALNSLDDNDRLKIQLINYLPKKDKTNNYGTLAPKFPHYSRRGRRHLILASRLRKNKDCIRSGKRSFHPTNCAKAYPYLFRKLKQGFQNSKRHIWLSINITHL